MKRSMRIDVMVVETTGLTDSEQREIEERLKPFYSENHIGTITSPYYTVFAKSIVKKSTAEAQIELNKWKARGLNAVFLQAIAKNVSNKDLTT